MIARIRTVKDENGLKMMATPSSRQARPTVPNSQRGNRLLRRVNSSTISVVISRSSVQKTSVGS